MARFRPNYHQVISPYLHEDFGTVPVNLRLQQEARAQALGRVGSLAGITLFDVAVHRYSYGEFAAGVLA